MCVVLVVDLQETSHGLFLESAVHERGRGVESVRGFEQVELQKGHRGLEGEHADPPVGERVVAVVAGGQGQGKAVGEHHPEAGRGLDDGTDLATDLRRGPFVHVQWAEAAEHTA